LAAVVGPVQNIFLTIRYFHYFVPIAQQAGQAAVLGRLPLSVCLWFCSPLFPEITPALLTQQTTLISRYTLKLENSCFKQSEMGSWFSIVQKFPVSILYFPYQLLIIQTQSTKNFTFSLFF
jgi:hypothetical protein